MEKFPPATAECLFGGGQTGTGKPPPNVISVVAAKLGTNM